ncbi:MULTISPECIES: alpha/beta fold hydrolase [Streptomyces]|uniref:N-acyl homoserine lactonase n=1 Tax=Streptomyces chartreusis NRRL 3882 TaxID=1079985 RepID=A0A2N9BLJ7_STRCX|nr:MULTISPECIES: alpha/beta hydrolase [Streptomyces]MYS88605.1 alpha/beta fold hydrolase [Streptomyces sp. SID5464]SOR84225.1 N-acyl homoserine lactonase [Streptomyces chartreusis NRRL 3882]
MTLLHVHDYGGDGPQLVLLHGFSRSLADWDAAATLLTAGHRVLAVDLPGHGRSPGISPWTLPAVVRHLADTLDAHGVPEAVVVGHSLGGIVAVEYARANPNRARARAAVNLDGFWWGREYPGAHRVSEVLLASAGFVAPPGYIEEKVVFSARLGIPADRAEAAARAAARPLPDGRWQTLPERSAALEIQHELEKLGELGVTTWLDGLDCPLLLVQAGRRPAPAPGMEWFADFSTRFAQEVSDELAALSRSCPTITVDTIDATHPMNLETPEAVATLVADFVRGLVQPSHQQPSNIS